MKKFYSNLMKVAAACVMLVAAAIPAQAKGWEKCFNLSSPYSVFKTSTGRILAGDLDLERRGGIFYSDDHGDTWQKAGIMRDYNWNDFCEATGPNGEKYIFAAGNLNPSIARSEDDGETWITMSYKSAMAGIEGFDKLEEDVEFGAARVTFDPEYHRVIACVQGFDGVVVYSDDYGETWAMTDCKSFQLYDANWGYFYDFPYGQEYFNGATYLMCMYHWYKLNPKTLKWTKVKRNGSLFYSNLMDETCQSPDGKWLFATSPQERGKVEGYPDPDFAIRTQDCANFEVCNFPEGEDYAYNRSIHHDGERLYITVKTKAAYYSMDNGDTWKKLGSNYPAVFMCMMTSDDKYVYGTGFDADSSGNLDGIYRIAKSELESGIEEVEAAGQVEGLDIDFNRYVFRVNAEGVKTIEIFNAAGQCVAKADGNIANIAALPFGAYIYKVSVAGVTYSGKFFK